MNSAAVSIVASVYPVATMPAAVTIGASDRPETGA
jgi:hypothetical protein